MNYIVAVGGLFRSCLTMIPAVLIEAGILQPFVAEGAEVGVVVFVVEGLRLLAELAFGTFYSQVLPPGGSGMRGGAP